MIGHHVFASLSGIFLSGLLLVDTPGPASSVSDERDGRRQGPLSVSLDGRSLRFGDRFSLTFQRTLRIPDDGKQYPLPPGLGAFPIYRVEDYPRTLPTGWKRSNAFFIPMYQREALWISFHGARWKPNAVKIGIGEVNALDGEAWNRKLVRHPQNYLVAPQQPWIDGIKAGEGVIRQFVAMPLGSGYTVEGQLTGKEKVGGIQIAVFDPKPGRFPDHPPIVFQDRMCMSSAAPMAKAESAEMGLAAGGTMQQKIYPDEFGADTWDAAAFGEATVYIVNSEMFREITGLEAPETPVTAKQYTEHGYPWFALYDERKPDIAATRKLKGVKGIGQVDADLRKPKDPADSTIIVPWDQVVRIPVWRYWWWGW